jgi:hypothetical protein
MTKQKITGPYKVRPVPDQGWEVVRIDGTWPSLSSVEARRKSAEEAHAHALETHPERPIRPLRDEASWTEQRAKAGQEIVRRIDGGKVYPQRQAAYRRAATLNRQWQQDTALPAPEKGESYYLEYPPFSSDDITILTKEEFAQDLPANYRYERVVVGGAEFPTLEALENWVAQENAQRH